MAKYRKKPVVIEAEQFNARNRPLQDGVRVTNDPSRFEVWDSAQQGWVPGLKHGDWIITGVKGERYPIKSDIFVATYEAAE